jgi:site-specific DNA recombinase
MVTRILKKELYCGVWHYGKKNRHEGIINPRDQWIPVEVPAIVSRETWEKAQERIQENRDWPNETKREYLVNHLCTCGLCGRKVHTYFYRRRSRKDGSEKEYRYYLCSSYRKRHLECKLPYFKVPEVDGAVWDIIENFITDPDYIRERVARLRAHWAEETRGARERLEVVGDLVADHERQMAKLLDLYMSDEFSKELLINKKEALQHTLEALKKERDKLTRQLEQKDIVQEQVEQITTVAHLIKTRARHSFESKRAWVEHLQSEVVLTVENDVRVVYLSCILGDGSILLPNTTSRNEPGVSQV